MDTISRQECSMSTAEIPTPPPTPASSIFENAESASKSPQNVKLVAEKLSQVIACFTNEGNTLILEKQIGSGRFKTAYTSTLLLRKQDSTKTEFIENRVTACLIPEHKDSEKMIANELNFLYHRKDFVHEHLLRIDSVFSIHYQQNNLICFIQQPFSEKDLFKIITEQQDIKDIKNRYRIMLQLFKVLQFFREHTIAHGDIKPENILVDSNWNIKVIDFGDPKYFSKTTPSVLDSIGHHTIIYLSFEIYFAYKGTTKPTLQYEKNPELWYEGDKWSAACVWYAIKTKCITPFQHFLLHHARKPEYRNRLEGYFDTAIRQKKFPKSSYVDPEPTDDDPEQTIINTLLSPIREDRGPLPIEWLESKLALCSMKV